MTTGRNMVRRLNVVRQRPNNVLHEDIGIRNMGSIQTGSRADANSRIVRVSATRVRVLPPEGYGDVWAGGNKTWNHG